MIPHRTASADRRGLGAPIILINCERRWVPVEWDSCDYANNNFLNITRFYGAARRGERKTQWSQDGNVTSESPSRNTEGRGWSHRRRQQSAVSRSAWGGLICNARRALSLTINNYDLSRRGGLKIICSRLRRRGSLRWWHVIHGRRELWLMHICCISSSLSQY